MRFVIAVIVISCAYVTALQGNEPIRLTTDGRFKRDPVFLDKNGTELLYVVLDKPTQLRLTKLVLTDRSSTPLHSTETRSEFEPAVSADGRYLAYVQNRGNLTLALVIHDQVENLTSEVPPGAGFSGCRSPTFAPDNSRLLFSYPEDGRQQIYSVNLMGKDRQTIIDSEGVNNWPHFASDGRRFTFSSSRDDDYEIYIADSNGSNPRRLTDSRGQDLRPRFSPDGSRIAFTSNRDGNYEIYVMQSDGANVVRVTNHPELDDYPIWHPNGKQLMIVSERNGKYDLYQIGVEPVQKTRVKLLRNDAPAAARVGIIGGDEKPCAPEGAAIRQTKRNESYFYAANSFDVMLPPGRAKLTFNGGLEYLPQTITVDGPTSATLTVRMQPWIDLAARGWYSGDSHVHLHTGGPIDVTVSDALVAARAEGVNYVNLCVSNNVGDDIRDAQLINGRPDMASTDRQLLVFGEEMRSTIYGHMQFLGIKKLVEPQYTGFDKTPNDKDFPANFTMAEEAVRQGAVVTYSHPMFAGQPSPFDDDLAKPSGAARELPIDAMLNVVHAMDLMSYNSDEDQSAELWYRLLNCGLKLSACVGTDALLDRSTDPLGGARVYVKTVGPLTMESWLEGLRKGRSFVTNGPIPSIDVNGKGPGESCELDVPGKVKVSVKVESYVPFRKIEVLMSGKVAALEEFDTGTTAELRVKQFDIDLPIERSSWIAVRVRGPDHQQIFDGPAWAHTSPVYVNVANKKISSRQDAEFFVDWIEQLIRAAAARNRFAAVDDRKKVEMLFRKAQDEFRKMAKDE